MSKYHAIPTVIDGIRFDSKAEAARYCELKLLETAGEIFGPVICHMKFPLSVNDQKICTYEADFVYWDSKTAKKIVEDVKGVKTPVYRLKKKLMKAIHNIDILETK